MNRTTVQDVKVVEAVRPAVFSGNATGQAVDTRGFDSLTFAVCVGAIAGAGNMTLAVQESDASGSGYADVAAADLEGSTLPAVLLTNTALKVGYRGTKRYVRLFGTLNSGTSVAVGANAILGHAAIAPTE